MHIFQRLVSHKSSGSYTDDAASIDLISKVRLTAIFVLFMAGN
jgi:hypothetical protein